MIKENKIEQLKAIFSDATLVDIDLSHWDSDISLYVVADHIPRDADGQLALVAIRFSGVRRFEWSFKHHDFKKFPLNIDRNRHLNWNIYQVEIRKNQISEIALWGGEQFPVLRLEFEDILIKVVDKHLFSDINPNWAECSQGLGRPGIERLHSLLTKLRRRK